MGEAQYMEDDPLVNAERLLAGVVEGGGRDGGLARGEWADLEVALAEVRRARGHGLLRVGLDPPAGMGPEDVAALAADAARLAWAGRTS